MAKGIELTLDEAKKHPESFMYVFVSDDFLRAIKRQYAEIIFRKRANQKKVLMLSADKYLGDYREWTQYYEAIEASFKEMYGVTPHDALIILAQGGEIAGKNWAEGMYGVGALYPNTFAGVNANGGSVTVDKTTGHIFYNGTDITDESLTIYGDVKGKTMAISFSGKDANGNVYQSMYNKTYKKYYAYRWTNNDGQKFNGNGKTVSSDESASIWGNITLDWDFLTNILNWILSLLGMPAIPNVDGSTDTKQLSSENTLPNQTADGFAQEAGMTDAAGLLLILAAGGALVATGGLKKKKGNK